MKYLILILGLLNLGGCITTKKIKSIQCPVLLPQERNPCELEHWENKQFKTYKSQNWKNYQDD